MPDNIILDAQKRDGIGKNKVNKLRNQDLIPAVIYAKGEDSINAQVSSKEFMKVLKKAGTSTIITLNLDGEEKRVLIKDFQTHPYKPEFLHIDFQAVRADQAIRVTVPVVLVGRDDIRVQPSVLIQNLDEVEVECLPKYIPQVIELDVTDMQIGESFEIKDLDIFKDENITILLEADETICSLQEPQEEKVADEEEEASAADVPTVGESEEEAE